MAAWQGLLEELVRDRRPPLVGPAAEACVCRTAVRPFVDRGRSTISGLSASPRPVAGAAAVDDDGIRLLIGALVTAAAPDAADIPTSVAHVNGGSWGDE